MAKSRPAFEEYNVDGQETWPEYYERFNCYCVAYDINDENVMKNLLLSVVGPTAYRAIRAVLAPKKPAEMPYDDLLAVVTDHFDPRPSKYVCRKSFGSRKQKSDEPVTAFVAALRQLAENCEFATAHFEDAIIQGCLEGLRDKKLAKKLMAFRQLTLDMVIEEAIAAEAEAKELAASGSKGGGGGGGAKSANVEPEVERLRKSDWQTQHPVVCFSCGKVGHKSSTCSKKTCYACGEKGHVAADCSKKKEVKICYVCLEKGHVAADCKKKGTDSKPKDKKEAGKSEDGHCQRQAWRFWWE